MSSDLQNDLINIIAQVLVEEIEREVAKIPFVAIIMIKTTDITNKCQLSTVLLYVDKTGKIQKRFVDFRDLSDDHTSNAVVWQLFNTLEEYQCENKLVAQTYDGAAMVAEEHWSL